MTGTPRQKIPEAMAQRAHCPVCNAISFEIIRSDAGNDQLHCKRCGAVFEVEKAASPRIRLVVVPKPLPGSMGGRWLASSEIRAAVREYVQHRSATGTHPTNVTSIANNVTAAADPIKPAPSSSETTLPGNADAATKIPSRPSESDLDAARQARELYQLGNPIPAIRTILEKRNEYTSSEIKYALADISALEQKKQAGTKRWMTTIGIIIIACLILLTIVFFLSDRQPQETFQDEVPGIAPPSQVAESFQEEQVERNPSPARSGNLNDIVDGLMQQGREQLFNSIMAEQIGEEGMPGMPPQSFQQMMPPEIKALTAPTPSVTLLPPSRSKNARCPRDQLEAADTFGGAAQSWTLDNNLQGWYLLADEPTTVRIPANMAAGYMVFSEEPELISINGPAVIENIYMLSVSCELN